MDTEELLESAKGIPNFIGVFPLDRLPLSIKNMQGSMIVNTQTHKLPGLHWIAVYMGKFIIDVFDPLGCSYPPTLINHLHKDNDRSVRYNSKMIQNPFKPTCGQHCIRWLKGETR